MKAFFLDRDGVINESHSINSTEKFTLLDGVVQAVRMLNQRGYEVFVVTNQGGVGIGYMSEASLNDIHTKMLGLIAEGGGTIREVKACIHKPSAGCNCRKPKPGMITELIEKYRINPQQSFMVGDRDVDIMAGQKAKVRTVLISDSLLEHMDPDYVFPTLYEAVKGLDQLDIL